MGDPKGFMIHERKTPTMRPVPVRLKDWKEVYEDFSDGEVGIQAARCMDCGIPFCNNGCPLGNLIPDWNELVHIGDWKRAIDALHATNNFPEFTGRLCPAPCEAACVAGINTDAVTIKNIELSIVERAFTEGWIQPVIPSKLTGKTVAVVGSGPGGLAVAQQLTRAGHTVTVYEKADRIGGLLRYGIPEFKLEKHIVDRRLEQMSAEGTSFVTNAFVGGPADHPNRVDPVTLRAENDAVVLAGGATNWRDLPIPGRGLQGIHQAMEYLPLANKVQEGDLAEPGITAEGKAVVIIGGGDTGADCLGTANRQGAKSVHQFEIMARPPQDRAESTPWPTWPLMMRTASAHEEGVERMYAVNTTEFVGDGADQVVTKLRGHRVEMVMSEGRPNFNPIDGTEFELDADLVLLAMGFTGPEVDSAVAEFGLEVAPNGTVSRDKNWKSSEDDIFVCGDMGRGQSLIVWAIAEGRSCAAAVDASLMGSTLLPTPVRPTDRPLMA